MTLFPQRLKELRTSKNITQKQMAELIKITERGYQNYEMGKSTPNFNVLIELADFFDVSIDYLVGKSDIKQVSYENKNNPLSETELTKEEEEFVDDFLEELKQDPKFTEFLLMNREEQEEFKDFIMNNLEMLRQSANKIRERELEKNKDSKKES